MYFRHMRFIKLNYIDGTSFTFALDHMLRCEFDMRIMTIVLTDGHEQEFRVMEEDFFEKAFSDETNEYQLIEIDEWEKPEPADGEAIKAIGG
jgi:hypothetical protein